MGMVSVEYNTYSVGQAIRDARVERKMSIVELSNAVGKSVNHLNHVELGTRKISVDLLYGLMVTLEVDANTLLGVPSKKTSVDDELMKLPKKQRDYFESIFMNMITAFSGVA